MSAPIQAIGLFSGGLDSILALRLMLDQGLSVEALHVVLPVHDPQLRGRVEKAVAEMGAPLHVVTVEEPFFQIVRRPRHGYGSGMNPCLDCRILLLRQAAARMRQVRAAFVFTGEVLDERPMSQHREGLDLVERKSRLHDRLLRPLSAQLLPPTLPEREGLVDRHRLLAIQGRRRLPQLELARHYGITRFPRPAGGCLLTYADSARRMRDLLDHRRNFSRSDFYLLRVGRHFRLSPQARFVIGRDEAENQRLVALAEEGDLFFHVLGTGSPVTLLRGANERPAVEMAAAATARYSDAHGPRVVVHYGPAFPDLEQTIEVEPAAAEMLEALRI